MTDIASRTTVRILERRSNRLIADLSGVFRSLHWTERFRRFGTGSFRVGAEDLPREAVVAIVQGNGAVHVVREWDELTPSGDVIPHVDEVFGPVLSATVRDGNFTVVKTDFSGLRNEIVVLGANEADLRDVTRRFDTTSQSALGLRELVIDARHLSTTAEYEAKGDSELAEKLQPQRELTSGGDSGSGYEWELSFADNLVYLQWRHVDTDGEVNIDPGVVSAGEYIRSLLDSELLAPSISRRTIDVPAVKAGQTVVGGTVDLPVRWVNLADVVRQACIDGDVGIRSTVNSLKQIEYLVVPVRLRTSGGADAVIWNRENLQREFDVRPGDKITVTEYFREDSVSPDLGPIDILCVARTITVNPNESDSVRLEMGTEIPTDASLLMAVERRGQAAALS